MDRARWGRGLALERWPVADRDMWDRLTRSGDDFDEAGALPGNTKVSQDAYRLGYAQWLQVLLDTGVDLSAETPDARVTLPRMRVYADAIAHLAPRTQALRFAHLKTVLQSAFPETNWRYLGNAANALQRRANAAVPCAGDASLPPSDALLEAGLSAILDAQGRCPLRPRDALKWRNGLLVALLACHAPRRRTLATLTLGTNFKRNDTGFAVWASGEDMKAGRSCAFRVSCLLNEVITGYLELARPQFPNGDDPTTGPLWLTSSGRALGPQGIKSAVAAITETQTGQRITPHRFRHAAMTTMATADGFDARHGQAFLDHRRPEISEQYYNLASQLDAGRAYAKLLEKTHRTSGR